MNAVDPHYSGNHKRDQNHNSIPVFDHLKVPLLWYVVAFVKKKLKIC